MKKTATYLILYSSAHFFIDFTCAYLMFARVSGSSQFALMLFFYNFCAFALQMPLGLVTDRLKRCGSLSAAGCLLLILSLLLPFGALPLTLAAGLGNALFHIGGGTGVLRFYPGRCTEPGIFVSTGAIGLYFGTIAGKPAFMPAWIPALVMAALFFLLLFQSEERAPAEPAVGRQPKRPPSAPDSVTTAPSIAFPFICLMLVVCIRSYLGLILKFDWKSQTPFGLILILAIVCGKALGGVLSDRFGSWRTVLVSLGASGVLFLLSGSPLPGIAAVLLFNMTMPITLTAFVRLLPGQQGFCFGLLTFALFLGFLPVALNAVPGGTSIVLYAALAFLSLLLMAAAWKNRRWDR
ncbi:MFS transporter [Wansuia hejianensis]|uniref:MFS transporter n=1 Tax=Wansuia hejianensis TaxID=2763667 RepID=A0A7G9GF25_9FIRM|nr:hypothetical protein [Wansuia hejianensis]QNM09407.1 hypothetical protein H9Q79_03730 [Wansuia hejianensis]RHV91973.1 hypothetical protein DXA96_01295 [Lachnospiraceae bacterium OF09-33XD]